MQAERERGDDQERRRALEALRGGRRFLLVGHQRPDGDCLGSELGLRRVLEALGKQVQILNPDPVEAQFDFLLRECPFGVYAGEALPEHDCLVMLDFCELSRCGAMQRAVTAAPSTKVVIDHHVHVGTPWWDAAWRDPGAASTGVLVRRIASQLGVPIDLSAARGLFLSLVTDTGWFRYGNTDAEALRQAAELVEAGVDPGELFRLIHQRSTPGQPRAIGSVLRRLIYHADGRLAVVDWPGHWVSDEQVVGSLDDTEFLLDILRSVGQVEVVLFVRELGDGSCKISARSKTDDYDVQQLVRPLGGGGHARAAGVTLVGPLEQVRERVVQAAIAHFGPPAEARDGGGDEPGKERRSAG